jgi:hypothetical protein
VRRDRSTPSPAARVRPALGWPGDAAPGLRDDIVGSSAPHEGANLHLLGHHCALDFVSIPVPTAGNAVAHSYRPELRKPSKPLANTNLL